jgi:hypothetical protein
MITDEMKQRIMNTNLCKEIIMMPSKIRGAWDPGFTMRYDDNWFFLGHNKTYWPYQHTLSRLILNRDPERWCWDNISHGRYWRNYGNKFAFKRKEDAALFMLTWA